ncbi:MAG: MFS transporter [Solirubrobacteraceae bacterium]|nr:MFS transporter [Solirubrobacteraceae bacterium]
MTTRSRMTRRGLLLGAVAGTSGFGISAPGVVLPDVADALGVGDDATAWVLAAFVLGVGVAMTLGGRALDLFGSYRVSAAGVIATLLGTVLVFVAPDLTMVSVGRFVQGVGSGWLCITAFNAVSYVDVDERARVSGILTAVSFTCIAISPLIGAVVEAIAGWRAALSCGLFILLPVPAMLRGLPPERRAPGSLDLRGAAFATAGAALVAAVLQAPATGTPAWIAVLLAVAAVGALTALARHLARRPDGFLPLAVLRNRELMELSFTAATLQAAYTGLIFAAPMLLAREAGWSALQTGVALAPCALVAATSAHLAGTVGARLGAPVVFVACCSASAAGVLVAGLGGSLPAAVIAGSVLTIAPYAGVQAVMLGKVSTLVAPEDIGVATGTFTYVFITGGAVGAAAAGGLSSVVGLSAAVAILVVLPLAGLAMVLRVRAREDAAPLARA